MNEQDKLFKTLRIILIGFSIITVTGIIIGIITLMTL